MDLKIRDVSELLNVSETTIRRWLSEGKIPAYKLHHQYRFSRTEIENWMLSRRLGVKETPETEKQVYPIKFTEEEEEVLPNKGWKQFSLFRALHKGATLHKKGYNDKALLISDVMRDVAPHLFVSPEGMTEMLLEREALMPTSLGKGIAVPHTRDFLLKGSLDVVCPVFLEDPIEWGALDNEPVHTLFFLFASDDKKHLNLLAKLAHLANDSQMRQYFRARPEKNHLLEVIKQWEQRA
ncbi:MAG: PTS sugar transporter subunit IIA [Rhabdochlamydiaceae bacterium]|nr:PTS sugar transporter subunit IIA [Candidatus Amphrikana amoebophyrae]